MPSSTRKYPENPPSSLRNTLTPSSVKLPKSFVAIDLSEKIPDAFERRTNGKGKEKDDPKFEDEERGRSEERKEDFSPKDRIPIADESNDAMLPNLQKEMSPAKLPPPALDA